MKKIKDLYRKCKKSETNFIFLLLRFVFYKIRFNQNLYLQQNVIIKGAKNIISNKRVEVGIGYVGFMLPSDKTLLNIQGSLLFDGPFSIGRGCRFDVGKKAVVKIGKNGYINANSQIIIMHHLEIGERCAISWDCQFLDDDFHQISYPDKRDSANSIVVGSHVWIGCGVKLYRGTVIPDGCVIAANSIIRGNFSKTNCLIGGNPARIIRENITWE